MKLSLLRTRGRIRWRQRHWEPRRAVAPEKIGQVGHGALARQPSMITLVPIFQAVELLGELVWEGGSSWLSGWPGVPPPVQRDAVFSMRSIHGIGALSYFFDR